MIFDIEHPTITAAVAVLRRCIPQSDETDVISRCTAQRQERVRLWNAGVESTVRLSINDNKCPY